MNASEKLLKKLLSRGEYLETLTIIESRKIAEILDRAHDDLLGKIARSGTMHNRAWLKAIKDSIDEIYAAATSKIDKQYKLDFAPIVKDELLFLNDEVGKILAGISLQSVSPDLVLSAVISLPAASGSTLGQLIEALGASANATLTQEIQAGVIQGETNEQIMRRLRGEVVKRASWRKVDGKKTYIPGTYRGGVMGLSTRQAEVLTRTATMHVANQARELYFEQNEDVIKGYQRVETLDGDTCVLCGAADGLLYKVGEPRPSLPQHPNCRGVYVPVMKSFSELGINADEVPPGTRASMDGQVPENETYQDRLSKMQPEKQDKLIGPTRGRLYRDGMPLADMVDISSGRIIPVKELLQS